MPDPTDRQRAEAMIPMCFQTSNRHGLISAIAAYIERCEQRARSEGWEAGREAAAKVADAWPGKDGVGTRGQWETKRDIVAAIRALPAPEDE